jgi:signal-transduction protein with cAMP-binding, CBS, and nucleotidyltransferase domain
MNPNAALPTFRLAPGTAVAVAQPPSAPAVDLDSPARSVLTDLTQVKAATTRPEAPLMQAEQTMIQQGVRMLFVVSDWPAVLGLITSTDLHGERAMRIVHDRGLRHDELRVVDVMTAADDLDAVDFDDLRTASVGNLVTTLQRYGRNHLLVLQAATPESVRRVRGVVSRTQIERQLGRAIELSEIASSFADIERALV